MKYGARKFSMEEYVRSDDYAKVRLKTYLVGRGHEVIKDVEDYSHDLVTMKDGEEYYFEFEVKRNYPFNGKNDYKFNSVSFLGRKERLHKIQPFYYMILCYETDCVVFCHSSDIFKEDYKQTLNLNRRSRKGLDEMFRVPIEKCKFFKIK